MKFVTFDHVDLWYVWVRKELGQVVTIIWVLNTAELVPNRP